MRAVPPWRTVYVVDPPYAGKLPVPGERRGGPAPADGRRGPDARLGRRAGGARWACAPDQARCTPACVCPEALLDAREVLLGSDGCCGCRTIPPGLLARNSAPLRAVQRVCGCSIIMDSCIPCCGICCGRRGTLYPLSPLLVPCPSPPQVELLSPEPLQCPISLEAPPLCPQITPCGHVFAFHSLMAHLLTHGGGGGGPPAGGTGRRGASPCPLCFQPLVARELRLVRIHAVTPAKVRYHNAVAPLHQ